MPYQIDRYNGTPLVTVDDGTVSNEKTTLKLVGKNYAGYGEIQNENFVFLMENFANANEPANALSGQIWFDSLNRKLKFNDGSRWRTTGGAEIGPTAPIGLTTGDFWWNTSTRQLFQYDGISQFVLIGPQAVPGSGDTLLRSRSVVDTEGNRHAIIEALVDGKAIFIISKDTFILDSVINPITGFSYIRGGITNVDTNTSGVTTTTYRFWGSASDSDRLGGFLAEAYVFRQNAEFTGVASFDDQGFTVGNDGDISLYIKDGVTPTFENFISNRISFKIKNGLDTIETMQILGTTVSPGVTDLYDLGAPALRWRRGYFKELYADDFFGGVFHGTLDGISNRADLLLYSGGYRAATDANTPLSIMARDSSGNFAANIMTGTATQARYADLAERYEADNNYEPGTVVVFGGSKEITVTDNLGDHRVAGVVSTNPAYEMNVSPETEGFLPVALRGKVPVKVVGRVQKGDVLITSGVLGHAVSASDGRQAPAASIIGKALENKVTDDPGVIMAVIV